MFKALEVLTKEASFESTGYKRFLDYIYPALSCEGIFRLFKILITNKCQNNCLYCGVRARRNCQRFLIAPQQLARIFLELYKAKKVEGLFVSSGIYKSPDYSQRLILDTIYILRKKFNFRGFIHAKVLPSADLNLIKGLAFLADRVSINLEASAEVFFKKLCPEKDYNQGVIERLRFLSSLSKKGVFKSGITSQIVVGADKEKDNQILRLSSFLYTNYGLRRVYYSGFFPVKNTPLENKKPVSQRRILRLYQADVLIRKYGFRPQELFFDKEGNLSQDRDPKLVWAYNHREIFPVNVNKADLHLLRRVPGIGIKSSEKIIRIRKFFRFKHWEDLKKLRINIKRVKGWIRFD